MRQPREGILMTQTDGETQKYAYDVTFRIVGTDSLNAYLESLLFENMRFAPHYDSNDIRFLRSESHVMEDEEDEHAAALQD